MNTINKVKNKIMSVFFEVLYEKKFEDINIKDITDECEISRSSFYRNFNSLSEVLFYYLDKVYRFELVENINEFVDVLSASFDYAFKNKLDFEILNKSGAVNHISTFLEDRFNCCMKKVNRTYDSLNRNMIIASYVASLKYLISNDFEGKPISYSNYFINSINHILYDSIYCDRNNSQVISVANMRDSDAYTIANETPSLELMFRAGKAVYESVSWYGKVLIASGKGNNAGDGYVLAKLLKENNIDVTILLLEEKFSKDGKYYFDEAINSGVNYQIFDNNFKFDDYDIIVDCLLGTGFKGEVSGSMKDMIESINSSNKKVISVDINSGLNGDNGLTTLAIKSDLTISIGSYKSGHFLNMAKDYIKKIKNVDIGIKPIRKEYELCGSLMFKDIFDYRKNMSNKGTYGYLGLIGGSELYSGAIRLSLLAQTTLMAGAGVTLLAIPDCISKQIIPNILESTLYPLESENGFIKFNKEQLDNLFSRCKTIAIGMGMGNNEQTKEIVKHAVENYEGNLILDADALNALSEVGCDILLNSKARIILTPHIKEFSRLSKNSMQEILQNPVILTNEFAKSYRCVVLLKGPTTVVSDGDRTYLVNRGTAGMATAGSGDVLSGIISAIVSSNSSNLLLAASAAAYLNGIAGEYAASKKTDIGMFASETARNIDSAIRLIRKSNLEL